MLLVPNCEETSERYVKKKNWLRRGSFASVQPRIQKKLILDFNIAVFFFGEIIAYVKGTNFLIAFENLRIYSENVGNLFKSSSDFRQESSEPPEYLG